MIWIIYKQNKNGTYWGRNGFGSVQLFFKCPATNSFMSIDKILNEVVENV